MRGCATSVGGGYGPAARDVPEIQKGEYAAAQSISEGAVTLATLKDVARAVGLSITQASRALNDHSDVSEMTRKRVKAAACSLNYQANISARKLVTGRSGSVTKAPRRDSRELPADCLAGLLEGRPLKELQRGGPHELIIRNSTGPAPE